MLGLHSNELTCVPGMKCTREAYDKEGFSDLEGERDRGGREREEKRE